MHVFTVLQCCGINSITEVTISCGINDICPASITRVRRQFLYSYIYFHGRVYSIGIYFRLDHAILRLIAFPLFFCIIALGYYR